MILDRDSDPGKSGIVTPLINFNCNCKNQNYFSPVCRPCRRVGDPSARGGWRRSCCRAARPVRCAGSASSEEGSTVPFWISIAFWHFKLHIEIQFGDQMRTVIPHLKPILNNSKLKIEIQIEMKFNIYLSVQHLWQIATVKRKLRWETGWQFNWLKNRLKNHLKNHLRFPILGKHQKWVVETCHRIKFASQVVFQAVF